MAYILIALFASTHAATAMNVRFTDQAACEVARRHVETKWPAGTFRTITAVCVPEGSR